LRELQHAKEQQNAVGVSFQAFRARTVLYEGDASSKCGGWKMIRKDRWLTLAEVAKELSVERPELNKLARKEQVQYARRLLRRIENRNLDRYSRVDRGRLLVSRNALEYLRPHDGRTLSLLERGVSDLKHSFRGLKQKVTGHGARLRVLERKQELTAKYLEAMSSVDSFELASE
jgi:hypothetical protein